MVIALGAGYAETCKSGSGGGSAETAGENQYGAAVPTSQNFEQLGVFIQNCIRNPIDKKVTICYNFP